MNEDNGDGRIWKGVMHSTVHILAGGTRMRLLLFHLRGDGGL